MSKTKQPSRTWSMVLLLGIPLALVGVASMLISFATLIDVARTHGLPFPEVYPIVVDMGMISMMIAASQMRLRGVSGQWLAYTGFFVLSAVSVGANGAHALLTADLTAVARWAAILFAAIPPGTLLIVTHLVMKLIPDEKERAKLHALKEQAQVAAARVEQSARESVAPVAVTPAMTSEGAGAVSDAVQLVAVDLKPRVMSVDQNIVRSQVIEHFGATGERPTGAMVGEWLGGKSAKTGQRFVAKLDDEGAFEVPQPSLAIVGS